MGVQAYYDFTGDAPSCSASYTITWSKFANSRVVRLQYRAENSKGGWLVITVGNTATSYSFSGLLHFTTYKYRFVVKTTSKGKLVTATSTFTTPQAQGEYEYVY